MRYVAHDGYHCLVQALDGVRWPCEAHRAVRLGIRGEAQGAIMSRCTDPTGRLWWYAPAPGRCQLAAEGAFALGRGVITLDLAALTALLARAPWQPPAPTEGLPLSTQLTRPRGIVIA